MEKLQPLLLLVIPYELPDQGVLTPLAGLRHQSNKSTVDQKSMRQAVNVHFRFISKLVTHT